MTTPETTPHVTEPAHAADCAEIGALIELTIDAARGAGIGSELGTRLHAAVQALTAAQLVAHQAGCMPHPALTALEEALASGRVPS